MKDTLKLRSRGDLVKLLQFRLGELGYILDMDGYFGPQTEKIVKQFQKDNNLQADGIVGPQTWAIIEETHLDQKEPYNWDAPTKREHTGMLKYGNRGEYVRLMQIMLAELGYLITPDGSFGKGTERVVQQFQRDNSLVIDGVIGANTLQTLSLLYYYPSVKHPTPKNGRLDRDYFFTQIRKNGLFRSLSNDQVAGLNYILSGWQNSGLKDLRWLAYMLATVKHETAHTMLPIEEYGKGRGRTYGRKIKMSRRPYSTPNQIFYGRGYVQLTWYENYQKMGNRLGHDLLNNPRLALKPDIAMEIMIEGMTHGKSRKGDFTGRALENYFTQSREDWYNARRIINGTDKAGRIATYAKKFHQSLKHAAA